jgi:hypothetical protein
MTNEYSLYWWDRDGGQHEELRFVDAKTAVERAKSLSEGPASKLGMVKRIIITDGGDFTNFEWQHGIGVTFA